MFMGSMAREGSAPDHVPGYIQFLLDPASAIYTPRRASGAPPRSVARGHCGIPDDFCCHLRLCQGNMAALKQKVKSDTRAWSRSAGTVSTIHFNLDILSWSVAATLRRDMLTKQVTNSKSKLTNRLEH